MLAQTESVFALGNGHIGWRGNLDEGEPHGLPGSYLNGVYELRPLPYAEAGYGFPESGQTVVNVTNGKLIRLLVNDERARQMLRFLSSPLWRAYTSTYVEGYRLLRGWLEARPAEVSLTERFGRLLDEPLIPSTLRAA